MNTTAKITVQTTVEAPIEKTWALWTEPEHIMQWNNASDDWHTPHAENDPRTGGKFLSRMEAKDGSFGFDFEGVYDEVIPQKSISYTLPDGRAVNIQFASKDDLTTVTETFDPETVNSHDLQRTGWQAILDNFKRHVEGR